MKSYGETIQAEPLQQYFHMVLFLFQHFTTRNLEILLNFYSGHLCERKGRLKRYQKTNRKTEQSSYYRGLKFSLQKQN